MRISDRPSTASGPASRLPGQYAQFSDAIARASQKYGVPQEVLFGILKQESGGKVDITGYDGHGQGPWQIDDRFHSSFLRANANGRDIDSSTDYAAKLLKSNIDAFGGDLEKGIAAYNAGVGGVKAALARGQSADSATTGGNYARTILSNAREFAPMVGGRAGSLPQAGGSPAARGTSGTGGAAGPTADPSVLKKHELLQLGASGEQVAQLKAKLKEAGFDPGEGDSFDAKTEAAVRAYQEANGLQVDGVVGQQTWGAFYGLQLPPGIEMLKPSSPVGGVAGPGDNFDANPVAGPPSNSSLAAKLEWAKKVAQEMGLTITSTTGGTHAPGSYHYQGRAIDVAGSPERMKQFYNTMKQHNPTELFHDPLGGIKNGQEIGAIGGHGSHVHIAF